MRKILSCLIKQDVTRQSGLVKRFSAVIVAGGILANAGIAFAAAVTWSAAGAGDGKWNTAANWTSSIKPISGNSDTVTFSGGRPSTNDISSLFDIASVTISFSGQIIDGLSLKFSTAGTRILCGANAVTFNTPIEFTGAGNHVITTTSANPITFNGQLTGAGTLQYINDATTAGTVFKFASATANTINGFTLGNATSGKGKATIQIGMDDPFGGAGTTVFLNNSGGVTFTPVGANRVVSSGLSYRDNITFSGSYDLTFLGNGLVNNTTTRTIFANLDAGKTLTLGTASSTWGNNLTIWAGSGFGVLAAVVSDAGSVGVQKQGTGTWRFTGANVFTTKVLVQQGTLEFNSVENQGSSTASALGKPASGNYTIQLGSTTLTAGGTLKYIGSGHSTDRPLDQVSTLYGSTLDASGSGAISYLGGVAATGVGAKILTLTGTNAGLNTIGGAIVDSSGGATALLKGGSGTWQLTGTSTYTGPTTVTSGVFLVNGALDAGTTVTVSNGATLGGTGTINGTLLVTNAVVAPGVNGVGTLTNNLTGSATAAFKANAAFSYDLGASGVGDSIAFTALSPSTPDVVFNSNVINFMPAGLVTNATYTLMTFDAAGAYSGTLAIGSGLSSYTINLLTYTPTNIQLTVNGFAAAPAASAASTITTSSFYANWASVSGATGYRLDVATDDQFTSLVSGFDNLSVGAVTTRLVDSLTPGTTYYYRVRAENTAGSGASSSVITVSTVPVAPIATAATTITVTAFHANWTSVSGATGYRLDVATDDQFTSLVSGFNNLNVGNVTTYQVTPLSPNTPYHYRVRAENAGGVSANSGVITTNTLPIVASGPRTWDGGSAVDGNWSTGGGGGNWSGEAAPESGLGTDLIFATNTNNKVSYNDIVNGFELNRLTISNSVTLAGGALTFSGAGPTVDVVNASASVMISNNLQLVQGQTCFKGAGVGVIAGVVTNNYPSRVFLKDGPGTWVLGNVNVYDGGTVVNAGLLQLGAAGALPVGGDLAVNGGVVDFSGYGANIGTLSGSAGAITNGGGMTVSQAVANSYGGVITGSGALTKAGPAVLTLSGANTYTGGTTNSAGLLQLGAANAFPVGGALTLNGGAVDLAGYVISMGTLSGTAGSITNASGLTVTQAGDAMYSGTIVGAGSLTKAGSATLTMSGENTYGGGTTNTGGLLKLGSATALPAGKDLTLEGGAVDLGGYAVSLGNLSGAGGSITNDGGMTVTQTVAHSFSGAIVGDGSLTKAGAATLTLDNASTYSGLTRIDNGTLALGAGGSINNSSTILVAAASAHLDTTAAGFTLGVGRTLAGVGTVTGSLSVAGGGTVSPGVSGIGTLTNDLGGSKTAVFGAGATFTVDLGAPGTSDVLAFGGLSAGVTSVTFNACTINFVNSGGLAAGTYTLFTFSAANTYTGTVVIGSGLSAYPGSTFSYTPTSIQLTVALNSPWTGADDNGAWSQGLNWASGIAPASSTNNDLVFASNNKSQVSSNDIASPFEVNSLTFNTSLTVAGGEIKLAADGATLPTISCGANAITVNNGLILATNMTISTTTANPVTFNGKLSGPGKLTYLNAGTSAGTVFRFASPTANTVNGFTLGDPNTGNKGQATIQIAMDDPFGGSGSTLYVARDNAAVEVVGADRNVASGISIRGNPVFTGNYNLTFHGDVFTVAQARTISANLSGGAVLAFDAAAFYSITAANYGFNIWAGSGHGLVSGVLANPTQTAIPFQKQGSGIWSLAGSNTFTTAVFVQQGVLEFNSVQNQGSATASALGKPGSGNYTIHLGDEPLASVGTLKYIGSGHSTDRPLNLAATIHGGTVDASGSGPISFLGGVSATGLGNKTLTLTGTNAGLNTLGGAISNSAGFATALVKDGVGVWQLTGANPFTGTTTVRGGTLLVNGSLDAGSAVTVSNAATLGGTGTINGPLLVTNAVVAPGANGIGTLTNNLTGTATATFKSDASFLLELGAPGAGDSMVFSALTAESPDVLFNNNVINITNVGGLAAGSYILFAFDATNAYSGPVRLGSGLEAFLGSTLNLTPSNIVLNVAEGGARVWDGSNMTSGAWSQGGAGGNWSGNSAPLSAPATDLQFATNINSLVSSNDIASPFELNSIFFSNNVALAGWPLKLSGSAPTVEVANANATVTISNNLQLVQSQTVLQGAGEGIMAGVISNLSANLGLTKNGGGIWRLNNANVYDGGTIVNEGLLALGTANALPVGGAVTVNGGALDLAGYGASIGNLTGSGGSVTNDGGLVVTPTSAGTYAGKISGSGALTKAGAATMTLSGANDYSGGTINSAGLLKLGAANALPSSGAVIVNGGAVDLASYPVEIGSLSGTDGSITNNNSLTVTQTGAGTYEGVIAGSGVLTKSGNGILVLTNANTYSGGTFISAGVLGLGGSNVLGRGAVTMNGGVLSSDSAASRALTNAIIISSASQFGSVNTGSLFLRGNVNLGGAGYTLTVSNTTTLGGIVSNGALVKAGGGILVLTNANTYALGTSISAGVLALGANNVLGTGAVTLNGGALSSDSATARTLTNAVVIIAASQFGAVNGGSVFLSGGVNLDGAAHTLAVSNTTTLAGIIDNGGLTLGGNGTLILTNANTYSSGTIINSGTLVTSNSAALNSGAVSVNNGTLRLGRSLTIGDALSGGGAAIIDLGAAANVLTVSQAGNSTFSGALTNAGGLIKEGGGVLTLSGGNTFGGPTRINNGTLALGSGGTLVNSSTVQVSAASAVLDTTAAPFTLSSLQTLCGVGTVRGSITMASGSQASPGTNAVGTLTNDLGNGKTATFDAGALFALDIGGPGTNDVIVFTGLNDNNQRVVFNGNTVNFTSMAGLAQGLYTLFTFDATNAYSGTLTVGTGLGSYSLSTFVYTPSNIQLSVAAPTGAAIWDGGNAGSGAWSSQNEGGNWAGGSKPVSSFGTAIIFATNLNNNVSSNDIADPFIVNSLAFNTNLTLAGGQLKLSANGSTLPNMTVAGGGSNVFDNEIQLATNTAIGAEGNTSGNRTVIFNGQLTGPGRLMYANPGTTPTFTFKFAAATSNTISGFTLGDGTQDHGKANILIAMDDPFGGTGSTINFFRNTTHTITGVGPGLRTINSSIDNLRANVIFNGVSMTWNGNFISDGGSQRTLDNNLPDGETLTLAAGSGAYLLGGGVTWGGSGLCVIPGEVRDGANPNGARYGFAKVGSGTYRLTGANIYIGQTQIQNGTLEFNSIQTNGSPVASALGKPTVNGANEVIALGSATTTGTLKYIGSAVGGHTTDRGVNLAGTSGGGIIEAAGVGPILLLGGVSATGAGNKTLTLSGANATLNTLGGSISNSAGFATSLVKDGVGVWQLAGANPYTGTTTVRGGTLLVNGSLAAGSVVTVSNAATLGGTGTINGSLVVTNAVVAPGVNGIGTLTNNLTGLAVATFKAHATFSFELATPGNSDSMAFTALAGGTPDVIFNGNVINFTNLGGLSEGTYTLFTFDAPNAYSGVIQVGTGLEAAKCYVIVYKADRIELVLPATGTVYSIR